MEDISIMTEDTIVEGVSIMVEDIIVEGISIISAGEVNTVVMTVITKVDEALFSVSNGVCNITLGARVSGPDGVMLFIMSVIGVSTRDMLMVMESVELTVVDIFTFIVSLVGILKMVELFCAVASN